MCSHRGDKSCAAMQKSYFEGLIEAEMQATAISAVKIQPGDAARHAVACGKYEGLKQALEIYRKAARIDEDQGDSL